MQKEIKSTTFLYRYKSEGTLIFYQILVCHIRQDKLKV